SFYRRDHITDGSDFRACSRATSLQAKLERDAERRRARFDQGRATPTHAWRAGRAGSPVGAGIAGGRGIEDQELLAIAEGRPQLYPGERADGVGVAAGQEISGRKSTGRLFPTTG